MDHIWTKQDLTYKPYDQHYFMICSTIFLPMHLWVTPHHSLLPSILFIVTWKVAAMIAEGIDGNKTAPVVYVSGEEVYFLWASYSIYITFIFLKLIFNIELHMLFFLPLVWITCELWFVNYVHITFTNFIYISQSENLHPPFWLSFSID